MTHTELPRACRDEFEAWARDHGYVFFGRLPDGTYSYIYTQHAWEGFQAGVATQVA